MKKDIFGLNYLYLWKNVALPRRLISNLKSFLFKFVLCPRKFKFSLATICPLRPAPAAASVPGTDLGTDVLKATDLLYLHISNYVPDLQTYESEYSFVTNSHI